MKHKDATYQMAYEESHNHMTLIKPYKLNAVMEIFQNNLKVKRAYSIDLISGEILKQLHPKGILLITYIINAIPPFPVQIMVLKNL